MRAIILFLLLLFPLANAQAIDFGKALQELKQKSINAAQGAIKALDEIQKQNARASQVQVEDRSTPCNSCGIVDTNAADKPNNAQEVKKPRNDGENWGDTKEHSTNDSLIEAYGQVANDIPIVLISAKKTDTDQESNYYVTPVTGKFQRQLALRFGPGKYEIRFWYNKNAKRSGEFTYFSTRTVENRDAKNAPYLLPSDEVQSTDPRIIELAKKITKDAATNREKSIAIHGWVTKNIAYDVSTYFEKSYTTGYSTDALAVLASKKNICQGYSTLTAALHRAVGIPARIVTGKTPSGTAPESDDEKNNPSDKKKEIVWSDEGHAWNEILLDGKWQLMDTTWDAGYVDFEKKTFSFKGPDEPPKYLFPSEEEFAKNHRRLQESNH